MTSNTSKYFFNRWQFSCLVLLVLLSGSSINLSATTYYFSTAGDDMNAGTSPSSPKRSLAAAARLALPGNSLLFKRGDAWYAPLASLDLRNKSGTAALPVVIDAYGKGDKPVIAGLALLDDAGWQNIAGTNTWQQAVSGFSKALRLFINGKSKYKVNTSKPDANENNVDSVHEWYIKEITANEKAIVFVNNGSSTSPPKQVEILPGSAPSILLMEKTNYVTIKNIDFRGGAHWNVIHIEAPSAHIVFDSCYIQRANGSGLHAENSAQGDLKPFVQDLSVINCVIDKTWSAEENDPAITLSGDGIFLRHAVEGGLLRGNRILNWGHSGISITSYALGVHGVHRIVAELNDISAGASGYMHAIDMNGFDGLTTHNIIRRNYFHDYLVTGHILGSFNLIYSNIFAGVKVTKMPKHSHQGWAVDWYPWPYRGNGAWIEAHDNYLINNTFADAEEFLIMIGDHTNNPDPVRNNVIANNILCHFGRLALNVTPTVKGSVFVKNNNFWNADPDAPVARFRNADMKNNLTAAELNKTHPQFCSDNIQLDPVFRNLSQHDFRLSPKSPQKIRSGGTIAFNKMLGEDFVDFYGNKWDPRRPSMGAIQYRR